tara:strand:- start:4178 stop:6961 length:2784 start_codon:yes stop_codon:yes gene_type:complete
MSFDISNKNDWNSLVNNPPLKGIINLKNNILLDDINNVGTLQINNNVIFNGNNNLITIKSTDIGIDSNTFAMNISLFNLIGGSIFNLKINVDSTTNYTFERDDSGILCEKNSYGNLINISIEGFDLAGIHVGAFGGDFGDNFIESYAIKLKSRVNLRKTTTNDLASVFVAGLFSRTILLTINDCNWIGAFHPDFYNQSLSTFDGNSCAGLVGVGFITSISFSYAKVIDYNDGTLSSYPVDTAGLIYQSSRNLNILHCTVYGNLEKASLKIAHAFCGESINSSVRILNSHYSGDVNNRDNTDSLKPALIEIGSFDGSNNYTFENVYSENVNIISKFLVDFDYVTDPTIFDNVLVSINECYAPELCQEAVQDLSGNITNINIGDTPSAFDNDVNTDLISLETTLPETWKKFYKLGLNTLPILKSFCDTNIYIDNYNSNDDVPELRKTIIKNEIRDVYNEEQYRQLIFTKRNFSINFDSYGLRQSLFWGVINIKRSFELKVHLSGAIPEITILKTCTVNGNNNIITIFSDVIDSNIKNRFISTQSLYNLKRGVVKNLIVKSKTNNNKRIITRDPNQGILCGRFSKGSIINCKVLGFELGALRNGSFVGSSFGYSSLVNENFIINCESDSKIRFHTNDNLEEFNNSSTTRTNIRCSGIAYDTVGTEIIGCNWTGSFDRRFFKDLKEYVPIEGDYIISGIVGFCFETNIDDCFVKVKRIPVTGGGLIYRAFGPEQYSITRCFVDCELERLFDGTNNRVSHSIIYESFFNNCNIECVYHNGKIIDHDNNQSIQNAPSLIGHNNFQDNISIIIKNCYSVHTGLFDLVYNGDVNNATQGLTIINSYAKETQISTGGFTDNNREILINNFVSGDIIPIEELNGLDLPDGWEECYKRALPFPALKNFNALQQPFFLPRSKAYFVSHSAPFININSII